jgi:hypothetical protein
MSSLRYQLQTTATGDLSVTDDPQMIATDRARLFLDCVQGDRPLLPQFGLEIGLFQPEVPQTIQDAQLQRSLDRWCGTGLKVSNGDVRWSGSA